MRVRSWGGARRAWNGPGEGGGVLRCRTPLAVGILFGSEDSEDRRRVVGVLCKVRRVLAVARGAVRADGLLLAESG